LYPNPGYYYSLTTEGKNLLNVPEIQKEKMHSEFLSLANSDISWLKVNSVKKIKSKDKWVYDLTVKDNHNFIANNIIVHNTTTTAKLARYYKNHGFKPLVIAADTFRKAAFEQLEQLALGRDGI